MNTSTSVHAVHTNLVSPSIEFTGATRNLPPSGGFMLALFVGSLIWVAIGYFAAKQLGG